MDIALQLQVLPGFTFKSLPADISIANGDLVTGSDLENAILIALFTQSNWWGNKFLDDPIGSDLYLIQRRGVSRETLNLAKIACIKALQPLVKIFAVASFSVDVTARGNDGINISVLATQPNGTTQTFLYQYLWDQIEAQI
jgi:phage gp46-like protein